jgi:hypothetical protein
MKRFGIAGVLLVAVVLFSKAFAYPTLNSFLTVWNLPLTGNVNLNDVYSGGLISNLGATDAQTLTLPRATPGLHITVSLAVAEDVDIDPQTGDQILVLTDEAGDAITSSETIGDTVELVALDDTNWLPIRIVRTWTNANP